jgi:hypothetical protein
MASTLMVNPAPVVKLFWLLNRIIKGEYCPMLACMKVLGVEEFPHNLNLNKKPNYRKLIKPILYPKYFYPL